MIQVVLIFIAISIFFFVGLSNRREIKSKRKNFDEILENSYKGHDLFFEEKETHFLDKISNLIVVDKMGDYKIITNTISLIKQGYTDENICKILNIDKGELQLITTYYKE